MKELPKKYRFPKYSVMECIKQVMSLHKIHNFNKFTQIELIKFLEISSEKINVRSLIFSLTSYEILTLHNDKQFSFSKDIELLKSEKKSIYVKNCTDKVYLFQSISEHFTPKHLRKERVLKHANYLLGEYSDYNALNATEIYMKNSLEFRDEPKLITNLEKECELKINSSTSHLKYSNYEIDYILLTIDEIKEKLLSLKTIS